MPILRIDKFQLTCRRLPIGMTDQNNTPPSHVDICGQSDDTISTGINRIIQIRIPASRSIPVFTEVHHAGQTQPPAL